MTSEILAPTICPDCLGPIIEVTDPQSEITTHWCENVSCAGRVADMLTFAADRTLLEIEGLGPEIARQLADQGFVVTLADLVELCNDLRNGQATMGDQCVPHWTRKHGLSLAAISNIIESVETAKWASWDRWLASLGIPMIGVRLSTVLAKTLELGEEDMASLPRLLVTAAGMTIEGFGFHKKAMLVRYGNDPVFQLLTKRLHESGVRPRALKVKAVVTTVDEAGTVQVAPLAGMVFCITGEMYDTGSRQAVSDHLVILGAIAKSGVSKKLTHLLVGTEPGRSKLTKAKDLNIPTLDETWLKATFDTHNINYATKSGMDLDFLD